MLSCLETGLDGAALQIKSNFREARLDPVGLNLGSGTGALHVRSRRPGPGDRNVFKILIRRAARNRPSEASQSKFLHSGAFTDELNILPACRVRNAVRIGPNEASRQEVLPPPTSSDRAGAGKEDEACCGSSRHVQEKCAEIRQANRLSETGVSRSTKSSFQSKPLLKHKLATPLKPGRDIKVEHVRCT